MFHPEREEVAHYFRFNELYVGRRYTLGDTPQSGPTGEPVAVDWDARLTTCARTRARADYPDGSPIRAQLEEFNHAYTAVLHLLHESFNGSPRLLAVATGLMYGLKDEAVKLMQLPTRRRRDDRRPELRVGAAAAAPPLAAAPSRRSSSSRTGRTSSTATSRSSRKKKITSAQGDSIAWQKTETIETEDTYALCRCGQSSSKPFCDGTHARVGFDGTEAGRHAADDRADPDRRGLADRGDGETVLRGRRASSSSATATSACTPRSASAGSSGSRR